MQYKLVEILKEICYSMNDRPDDEIPKNDLKAITLALGFVEKYELENN